MRNKKKLSTAAAARCDANLCQIIYSKLSLVTKLLCSTFFAEFVTFGDANIGPCHFTSLCTSALARREAMIMVDDSQRQINIKDRSGTRKRKKESREAHTKLPKHDSLHWRPRKIVSKSNESRTIHNKMSQNNRGKKKKKKTEQENLIMELDRCQFARLLVVIVDGDVVRYPHTHSLSPSPLFALDQLEQYFHAHIGLVELWICESKCPTHSANISRGSSCTELNSSCCCCRFEKKQWIAEAERI